MIYPKQPHELWLVFEGTFALVVTLYARSHLGAVWANIPLLARLGVLEVPINAILDKLGSINSSYETGSLKSFFQPFDTRTFGLVSRPAREPILEVV